MAEKVETRLAKTLAAASLGADVVRRGDFSDQSDPGVDRTGGKDLYAADPACWGITGGCNLYIWVLKSGRQEYSTHRRDSLSKAVYLCLSGMDKLSAGDFYDLAGYIPPGVFSNSKKLAGRNVHRDWVKLVPGQPALL